MAEAITILGATRSSQQVLWDFSQLIRRYRHLPGRVLDLEENLNCCQVALSVWRRQWDVADHHPGIPPIKLSTQKVSSTNRGQTCTTRSSGAREVGARSMSASSRLSSSRYSSADKSIASLGQPSSTRAEAGNASTMGGSADMTLDGRSTASSAACLDDIASSGPSFFGPTTWTPRSIASTLS